MENKLRLIDKIVLAILLIVFLFAFYVTLDANKYRALVQVVEGEGRVGVNPTAEALDFEAAVLLRDQLFELKSMSASRPAAGRAKKKR